MSNLRKEDIDRIFKPFEQADAVKNYQGTGLGLALTKDLVELHGGRIWAQSNGENTGSVFRLILPNQQDYPMTNRS